MRSIQSIFQTFLFTCPVFAQGSIEGTVTDKKTGEPIIGAAISVKGTTQGTATDGDGKYVVHNISGGKYKLRVSYISYAVMNIQDVVIQDGKTLRMDIVLEEVTEELEEVTVRAERRMNNEVAMISAAKAAPVVMNGVSGRVVRMGPAACRLFPGIKRLPSPSR